MKRFNDIEEEVDAIRDKLYGTIKNMTTDERVKYINIQAQEVIKKQGIVVNSSQAKPIAVEKQ